MSKVILNGFRINELHNDGKAILLKDVLWFDNINNQIKVGDRVLNYYIENNKKILTTLNQSEIIGKTIYPIEFTIVSPI